MRADVLGAERCMIPGFFSIDVLHVKLDDQLSLCTTDLSSYNLNTNECVFHRSLP